MKTVDEQEMDRRRNEVTEAIKADAKREAEDWERRLEAHRKAYSPEAMTILLVKFCVAGLVFIILLGWCTQDGRARERARYQACHDSGGVWIARQQVCVAPMPPKAKT